MLLLPQKTKNIWLVPNDSHQFLKMHPRKYPVQMHHSLVWQLLCLKTQETAERCGCKQVHNVNQPPSPTSQHYQRPLTPQSCTLLPSPVGQELQKHGSMCSQIQEQLLAVIRSWNGTKDLFPIIQTTLLSLQHLFFNSTFSAVGILYSALRLFFLLCNGCTDIGFVLPG